MVPVENSVCSCEVSEPGPKTTGNRRRSHTGRNKLRKEDCVVRLWKDVTRFLGTCKHSGVQTLETFHMDFWRKKYRYSDDQVLKLKLRILAVLVYIDFYYAFVLYAVVLEIGCTPKICEFVLGTDFFLNIYSSFFLNLNKGVAGL